MRQTVSRTFAAPPTPPLSDLTESLNTIIVKQILNCYVFKFVLFLTVESNVNQNNVIQIVIVKYWAHPYGLCVPNTLQYEINDYFINISST